MKYALIVMEANPLHYGHHYLIRRAREDGYRLVILMSGSFTQRGLPVVTDKFQRARDLIDAGSDLVITLPVQIATSYGEMFSFGAMSIADRLELIDAVYCGTEWGDNRTFDEIYAFEQRDIFARALKDAMAKGTSYSHAYLDALKKKDPSWEKLFQSNALLAYGYYKALKALGADIDLKLVARTDDPRLPLLSATEIRRLYATDPEAASRYSFKTPPQYDERALCDVLYILYRFLSTEGPLTLGGYDGYENGIDRRIEKNLKTSPNFSDFLSRAQTKRYSKWRISRILLHKLLGLNSEDIRRAASEQDTFQVLAYNDAGIRFLSRAKHTSANLLTNFKHAKKYPSEQRDFLANERRATDLWNVLAAVYFGRYFYGK
ncbi:MAG: nucleotidyltransferase family protein [Firmicutes bacterium]|nr:nucleotidyltransferase family protein [Bacillota bacterium]